jgi:hypothetical protein
MLTLGLVQHLANSFAFKLKKMSRNTKNKQAMFLTLRASSGREACADSHYDVRRIHKGPCMPITAQGKITMLDDEIQERTGGFRQMCSGVNKRTMLLRLTPIMISEGCSETGKNMLHIVG